MPGRRLLKLGTRFLAIPPCNPPAAPPARLVAVEKLNKPSLFAQRQRFVAPTARVNSQGKPMQLKVTVTSERPDEYIGKRGLVKNQVITCQDIDPSGYRLLMPFDYTLSEDEKVKYAGKLQDKTIVVGVRELMPFGGRLRARGAIVTGPEGK